MNYVVQEDPKGCGIACVAMLSNRTYEEVRKVFLKKLSGDESVLLKNGRGLTWQEIKDLLAYFRLPVMRLCNTPCIVSLGRHFIVIDSNGNKMDPTQR
jgi:hypothetical protein